MKFGPVPVSEALGGVLVHAVRHGDFVLKKGALVGEPEVAKLHAAGIAEISVARLDDGDVPEDPAAHALASHIAGGGVRVEKPFTGRSNLFAEAAGVLVIDTAAIDAINVIDESVTVATLPGMRAVTDGEMIGTVKIIPFAVPGSVLDAAKAVTVGDAIRVAAFKPKKVGVVSTLLPGLKPAVVDKTLATLAERLKPAGARILDDRRSAHKAEALTEELKRLARSEAEIIIVFGASAITDRRDVIPAAIEMAGGTVDHFGMPVDPGNLLLIGTLAGKAVIGAPGCARSPKENGFDWVLQRLLADVPVTRADIQRMGVGGLLMEIVSRPQPRQPKDEANVAALVLAAGRGTRMGGNKMNEMLAGKPLLLHAVDAALGSKARPVIVVTGHQPEKVKLALVGRNVTLVHNPHFAEGLSTSLKAGLAAIPAAVAGAVVLLGDMPHVTPVVIDDLRQEMAKRPEAAAIVPVVDGQRGNPVLLGRRLFAAALDLHGDTGARKLLGGPDVVELPVEDEGVLLDIDTPDALAAVRLKVG